MKKKPDLTRAMSIRAPGPDDCWVLSKSVQCFEFCRHYSFKRRQVPPFLFRVAAIVSTAVSHYSWCSIVNHCAYKVSILFLFYQISFIFMSFLPVSQSSLPVLHPFIQNIQNAPIYHSTRTTRTPATTTAGQKVSALPA